MLHFSPFKTLTVVGICVWGFLALLPNLVDQGFRDFLKSTYVLPHNPISLGLDLRGGSYLLLEVHEEKVFVERLKSKVDEVRAALRKAEIPYSGLVATPEAVTVKIIDAARFDEAAKALNELAQPITNVLAVGFGEKDFKITQGADGHFSMAYTDAAKNQVRQQVIAQSVEVVRKRVDAGGTKEASVQRQGADRILVQVPGLDDPKRLIELLGKTAKMTFHLVDDNVSQEDILANRLPPGTRLLYEKLRGDPTSLGTPVVIREQAVITGDMLERSSADFDSQSRQPIVSFQFDGQGARRFADVSRDNIGRRFAIVLDEDIISAPVIRSAILGGRGQIEGGFTPQSAQDLAVLLNAGALPAEISILEQRVVGEELGKDAIDAGYIAAIGGLVLVVVFMVITYGLFGVFANVALVTNLILLAGMFSVFGLTLTLPGIAAFVLTMGMAVDANVLIYERIREEHRMGKGIISAIDAGFERAMSTIIDSNLTTLISGVILILLATGPVRGFGVALSLGIITSVFTAIYVTRLLVTLWLRNFKPAKLAM